ncbi:MAG: hypothetical protein AB7O73_05010 [Bacteroidia bacterium]
MNRLAKIVVCIIVLWVFNQTLFAQKDKVEALRASFINKKLELNKDESVKFWPVYNEMNDKLRALKIELRKAYRKLPPNYNEAQAEEIIKLENNALQAEADITKSYYEKLASIIGVKKLVQLQIAEKEFKKEVINLIKEK